MNRIPAVGIGLLVLALGVFTGCSSPVSPVSEHISVGGGETPQPSATTRVGPSVTPSPATPHTASWADINGTWCNGQDPCVTISNLVDNRQQAYIDGKEVDQAGCLLGTSTASGSEDGAMAAYCPSGSAFALSASCGIQEDVSRDRLYVYQGCSDPMYRQ